MSQFIFPPLTASLDSEQTNGGSLPAKQMIIGGYDGANVRAIKVDAAGDLQVDVVSAMPLPTGAATSALQTAGNNILTTIDADTGSIAGAISGTEMQVDVVASLPAGSNNIGDVDVLSSALPTGAATSALQTTANGILTTIDADTSTLAGAVSGTEMQVDIVASLPAGSNNIGDVDVLSSALPTGAATSALQTSSEAILTTIDADTGSLAGCVSGTEVQVDVVSGSVTVVNSMTPIDFLNAGVFDASTGTNIPTAGSAVLVTMAADCKEIEVIDDIGEYMSLRLTDGTVKAYLPLGGGRVKCHLSTGNEMKLYSETGTTINSGKIAMNFLA